MNRIKTAMFCIAASLLTSSVIAANSFDIDFNNPVAMPEDKQQLNTLDNGATSATVRDFVVGKNATEKITFIFNGNEGWLNKDGEWQIAGYVRHSKLWCATYQVSMRFGKGEFNCTNVKWIGDYQQGSTVKQCNNASMMHVAGGTHPDLYNSLDKITCAQVRVTCTGRCK